MTIDWEVVRSGSVAISAIVACITFVIAVRSAAVKKSADETKNWQKVLITEIFQLGPDKNFSFDDLLSKYRSEASAYQVANLSKSQLSKETLRSILVELVSSRVVEHSAGGNLRLFIEDRYKQQEADFSDNRMSVLKGMMAEMMPADIGAVVSQMKQKMEDQIDGGHHVINSVGQSPGKYRLSDLALELQIAGSVSSATAAQAMCRRALANGEIVEREDGFLFPTNVKWENKR